MELSSLGEIEITAHVASGSRPRVHMGSTASPKLCRNLCSFKCLKFNLRRLNSLIPLVSCIPKTEFLLGLIKLRIVTLKVVSATFLLVCFVCLKERTSETRKNVFYFTSKALFVLEIIKF